MIKMMLFSNMDRKGLKHWAFFGALICPPHIRTEY